MENRQSGNKEKGKEGGPVLIILVLLLCAGGMLWLGSLYYKNEKAELRTEAQKILTASARQKEAQVTRWWRERTGDGKAIMKNPILLSSIERFIRDRTKESRKDVEVWLTTLYHEGGYSDVALIDTKLRPLIFLGADQATLGEQGKDRVRMALESGQIIMSDFHETPEYPGIHLDLVIPLPGRISLNSGSGGARFSSALFFRLDPSKDLLPFLGEQPTLTGTIETIIVRNEGGMAVVMHRPGRDDGGTTISRPVDSPKSEVEHQVLHRAEGVTEGRDYRGIPVLAAIRHIPDSSWFIVSKVDQSDVYRPLEGRIRLIIAISGLLIIVIALAIIVLTNRQTSRFYRQQYEEEVKHQGRVARFDYLTRYAHDMILLCDATGNILDVNERALTVYGYSRSEFLALNAYDLRAPMALPATLPSLNDIEEQGGLTFSAHHQKKDRTPFPVEISARVFETEGQKFTYSIIRDVSGRKKIEDTLREREKQYRTFLDSMSDMAFMKDDLFRHLMANRPLLAYFGKPEEEVLGKTDFELMPQEAAKGCRETDIRVLSAEDILVEEEEVGDRIYETRKFPVVLENGRRGIGGYIRDITIRKRALHGLEESEERFRAITETTASAVFTVQKSKFQYINPAFETITGYIFDDLKNLDFWDIIFPEDREETKARGIARQRGEDVPRRYEFRVTTKDGSVRWVDFSASFVHITGIPTILGTAIDITERKTAETELRNSEEKYRLLVQNASEAIIVAQEGFIKFANPKMAEISGYTVDELTSRSFTDFIHPEDRAMVASKHYSRLGGVERESYMFRAINRSNEMKWLEIHVVPFFWSGAPATLNFLTDITDRKDSEQALMESFENLHHMTEGIIEALARTTETRDPYTAGHQRRVAELAVAISRELNMTDGEVEGIRVAALLHDVGKIAVPAEILSKPGRLSDYEFSILKIHSRAGYDIVKDINFPWPVSTVILQHHERLDGSGYPGGISGDEIIREARILGVADVVESMASHRPYRPALGIDAALKEITAFRGIYYDPKVVDACVRLLTEKMFAFQ